jgi:membrane-bound lytic murein transglycosylase MltF
MFGPADDGAAGEAYDLSDVQAAGELIAVTLSGPDTYYEYRGQGFGLEFSLAQAFANSIGARLRMEMASDTAQLLSGHTLLQQLGHNLLLGGTFFLFLLYITDNLLISH